MKEDEFTIFILLKLLYLKDELILNQSFKLKKRVREIRQIFVIKPTKPSYIIYKNDIVMVCSH